MEIKQMEAFCMAAERKSFSEAARALYLTQPTISSHIRSLEQELGCILFKRTHKQVLLTPEGTRLYPYLRRIIDLKEEALREMNAPLAATVTIGASTIPSGYLLPELMSAYRAAHPNVFFHIRQSDSAAVEEMVQDGLVDFGITGRKCPDPHLISHPLCRDHLVLALPPTAKYREMALSMTADDIIKSQPVIMREPGSGTLKAIDAYLREKHIDPESLNICARNNDLEAIRRMISGGMGVSVLSGLSVKDMAQRGQLITMDLASGNERTFYLIRSGQTQCPAQAEEFMKWVKEKLGG